MWVLATNRYLYQHDQRQWSDAMIAILLGLVRHVFTIDAFFWVAYTVIRMMPGVMKCNGCTFRDVVHASAGLISITCVYDKAVRAVVKQRNKSGAKLLPPLSR